MYLVGCVLSLLGSWHWRGGCGVGRGPALTVGLPRPVEGWSAGGTGQAVQMPTDQPFSHPSSKALKPQPSPGVFGALQNFKEDKPQPVRDEYEYVSDDGELKIDEFPIRRKKNAPKRDLSCELGGTRGGGRPSPVGAIPGMWSGHWMWLD